MGGINVWARRIGESISMESKCVSEALYLEAYMIGECSCGCNGADGRKMLPYDGVVDGAVTVVDAVSPSAGRIVWLSGEKRFAMEVSTGGGDKTEYYASWRGHSAYQPENYDEHVYYVVDKNDDNVGNWQMSIVNKDSELEQVSGGEDTALTIDEIDIICK